LLALPGALNDLHVTAFHVHSRSSCVIFVSSPIAKSGNMGSALRESADAELIA